MSSLDRFRRGFALVGVAALLMSALSTGAGAARRANAADANGSVTGSSYLSGLIHRVPYPAGAIRLATPVAPVAPVTGTSVTTTPLELTRYYLLPASFDVAAFTTAHLGGSATMTSASSPETGVTSTQYSLMSLCADRHATYCALTESVLRLTARAQELRVDVSVIWMPVHVVLMPMNGRVTVTGYRSISWLTTSHGPVSRQLTATQARELRRDIASLRGATSAMCTEDAILYRITVSVRGVTTWTGVADECPGILTTTTQGHATVLNARSCPLDTLVSSFFAGTSAVGTRNGLKVCQPSW